MKTELIQLAKEKEFKSDLLSSEPMKYSHKEDTRYYLWMCELQRWLRNVHNIHISVEAYVDQEEFNLMWCYDTHYLLDIKRIGYSVYEYKSFELALEAALLEALKLIKDEE